MKKIIILPLLMALLSCNVAIKYDYDVRADFKAYKAYNFYSDINSGLSILDERRLIRGLEAALKDLGYALSDDPDFLIDIRGLVQETPPPPPSNVSVGFGTTGGASSGAIGLNMPMNSSRPYDEMMIEFVDETSGETFWVADLNVVLSSSSQPLKRDAYFEKLARKVLSKYPPTIKKK
jgi:hypothetical protein